MRRTETLTGRDVTVFHEPEENRFICDDSIWFWLQTTRAAAVYMNGSLRGTDLNAFRKVYLQFTLPLILIKLVLLHF